MSGIANIIKRVTDVYKRQMVFRPRDTGTAAFPVELSPLQKTTLRSTISTNGNVESTDSVNVYTNLTYPVKEILVEVGDHVNEGDVLCVLDSEDLQQQIKQQQISISTASANNQQQIETNQKRYDDAMETLNAGLNTDLNTAQQNVDDAKRRMDNAQKDLDAVSYTHLNWEGKTLIPFCTSGGSAFGRSTDRLPDSAPGATILEGLHIPGDRIGGAGEEVASWIEGLNLE